MLKHRTPMLLTLLTMRNINHQSTCAQSVFVHPTRESYSQTMRLVSVLGRQAAEKETVRRIRSCIDYASLLRSRRLDAGIRSNTAVVSAARPSSREFLLCFRGAIHPLHSPAALCPLALLPHSLRSSPSCRHGCMTSRGFLALCFR